MSGVHSFTDLRIWQMARAWSKRIFQFTRRKPFRSDRKLVEQINDSSESIMANISEGFGRGTQADFINFLSYSIGSTNETQTHLCAAYDREYLAREDFSVLFLEGTEIRKGIVRFMQSMTRGGSGVRHMRKYRSWSDEVWERYERLTGKKRPDLFAKKDEDEEDRKGAGYNDSVPE